MSAGRSSRAIAASIISGSRRLTVAAAAASLWAWYAVAISNQGSRPRITTDGGREPLGARGCDARRRRESCVVRTSTAADTSRILAWATKPAPSSAPPMRPTGPTRAGTVTSPVPVAAAAGSGVAATGGAGMSITASLEACGAAAFRVRSARWRPAEKASPATPNESCEIRRATSVTGVGTGSAPSGPVIGVLSMSSMGSRLGVGAIARGSRATAARVGGRPIGGGSGSRSR
jgi:hypothetical protein